MLGSKLEILAIATIDISLYMERKLRTLLRLSLLLGLGHT